MRPVPRRRPGCGPAAGRLVVAAVASGGDAYAAVAPPYEPPGASPEFLLHHRLAVLRYHRADAHAAAWLRGRSANASRPRPTGAPAGRTRPSAPRSGLGWCPA